MSVRWVKVRPQSLFGRVEGALADGLELEIGPQGLVVEIVFGLLQLFGVIPPVPRLELAGDRRPCSSAPGAPRPLSWPWPGPASRPGRGACRRRRASWPCSPRGRSRHASCSRGGWPGSRAGRRSSARTVRLSVALPLAPRLMKAWKSFSRRSRREEYWKKGMQLGLWRVKTHFPSIPLALAASAAPVDDIVGQAGQVLLLVEDEGEAVVLGQDVLAELLGQDGQLLVDLAELGFFRPRRGRRRSGRRLCRSFRAGGPARGRGRACPAGPRRL